MNFSGEHGDALLMRQVASQDSRALRELYDRYAPLLFTLSLRILRDRRDAEEVTGDVFFELWRRGDRFDDARGSVRSYLVLLARSRSIDKMRRRRAGTGPALADEGVLPGTAPVELAERDAAIRGALDGLASGQREMIERAFYEGLTHSQIAEQTGQPLGTVKTSIRRGLMRLRDVLKQWHERDGDT